MHVWMEGDFWPVQAFEAALIIIFFVTALLRPRLFSGSFRKLSRAVYWLAGRRKLAVALIGLLALIEGMAVTLVYRPEPKIHDEFSYLLAADTFASGRLSNPTHPMWIHFQSPHIIHRPTYASKYLPGQGGVLAAGKVFGGHPIIGVKISFAMACAAICWMLQAWLPLRWALIGGLLAVGHLGGLGYWSQSYWGGAVPVLGGALVFGSLRRILRHGRLGDALLMGTGMSILAVSRPLEGLVVSLPVAAALVVWLFGRKRPSLRLVVGRVLLPITVMLAITGWLMALYNSSVTGDPLRLPYQVYQAEYMKTPVISVDIVEMVQRQPVQILGKQIAAKSFRFWHFYLGMLFTVPLVALFRRRDRWTTFAMLTFGLLIAAFITEGWGLPHYYAPVTCLIFMLILQGFRYLRQWRWRGSPTGRLFTRLMLVGFLFSALLMRILQLQWVLEELQRPYPWNYHDRPRIQAQAEALAGRHLILVRYWPGHSHHFEWVYNGANIDGQKVVWAKELDDAQNRTLLEYFKERRIWLLEADAPVPGLVPYPNPTTTLTQG
jgi:hypothetical protein